ncbi:NmrA family NAD(P)-binding protein [Hymenobacter elongatus]|uniref:SDR family NAD(P)-dependent oxidoreductase n=1 Tax=Hymenobacter elongatus TaxID=877208 RepID=A0A4Z0PNJ0_9BACT|nr:NmrA family NAD(P)-binding protein [Hymenobacter elongatus]TGE17391.1 SDR family NAD(P)-dependent oxidoreductase [Hymenobacter elongatus]
MSASPRLLIIGATGNVGGAALRELLRQRPASTQLVVASREPTRDRAHLALGAADQVDVVPFDFTKPETVAPALRGVTGLLLVRPPVISDVARYLKPVVQAAAAAGVQHVVFLSLQGAQYNPFVPHYKVEGYLKKSGLRHSLLRPSFFMQNLSTTHRDDIRRRDQLLLPAGHARTSFVDAVDVGAVASRLLLSPPATSAGYELTGRTAFTYDEVAAQLSAVLGRPIRYHAASIRTFRAYERTKGTPPTLINVMTGIYLAARFGLAAHVSPELAGLLGREPGTLQAFLTREKACWLP